MSRPLSRILPFFLVGLALGLTLLPNSFRLLSGVAVGKEPAGQNTVLVGVIDTLFSVKAKETVDSSAEPFQALMKAQTGYSGKLFTVNGALNLGQQLAKDEVQLGVLHGFEFAWARQQNADLRPLVIAVNQQRQLRAYLMVSKDSPVADFSGLKGKSLAIPAFTKEHCNLFLERRCRESGQEPKQFFSGLTRPANMEDALDDVVDGVVQAALVDGVGVERYQSRKPGRFARLKQVDVSVPFPAVAVAYRPGFFDEATLQRFRTALKNAPESADGRQMLTLWKLTGFEDVPDNYEQNLAAILKVYPPPGSK